MKSVKGLRKKLGSEYTVGDLIARYLPKRELQIVAYVREHAMVAYCERKTDKIFLAYYSHIRSIKPNVLDAFKNAKSLAICNSKLYTIPTTIGNCINLVSLTLTRNCIEKLPDTFGNLSCLRNLSLSDNALQTLPDTFGNLTQLRYLYLECNQFEIFPITITKLTNLKFLDLGSNYIEVIPDTIGNLVKLQALYLNNQFPPRPAAKRRGEKSDFKPHYYYLLFLLVVACFLFLASFLIP
jgi:hypothetical protein